MLSCHTDPFMAFVTDLQIEGTEVHLYRGANTYFGEINLTFLPDSSVWKTWDKENIYFLAGVKPGLRKRAADSDVLKRGMFTLDFDVRKELDKKWLIHRKDTSTLEGCEQILEALSHGMLWQNYRYAVLSGNGLHVHYFGDPCIVVKEEWVTGMKEIFNEIDEFSPIRCDHGCGNAGRIMRMPGSWNVKDPTKKLPVDFLVWNPGASLLPLSFVQERGRQVLMQQNVQKELAAKEFSETHPEGGSDVIALINSIPIEQVVSQLFAGMKVKSVKKDGGMRFADEKGTERGFFKHHEFNVLVHEGTSLFPAPNAIGYNCLGVVKVVKGCGTYEAVQWFCERSAKVREAKAAERAAWAKENEAKDVLLYEKHIPTS